MNEDEACRAEQSRALVALAPVRSRTSRASYREAAFLAHLLAVKEGSPQMRVRRRVSAQEAVAAYRNIAQLLG
ncbi:MAG TPA: hypothetical protein VFA57_01900 [Pseudolabrys sp.]|jgi:hypothetical protein|nr:hypothetical protein [Pseudolabrys sp.]